MKILKSIKWRLQIWYGLILVVVLAGFGLTAFQLERGRVFRNIDDQLGRRADALMVALHPPGDGPGGRPFGRPPPLREPIPVEPDSGPRARFGPPPEQFHLPQKDTGLFDPNDPNGFYFIITLPGGLEFAKSTNAPAVAVVQDNRPPAKRDTLPPFSSDRFHPVAVQMLGKFRQMIRTLPSGETIQVGCLVAPELKEIRLAALRLVGVGGIILLFGLAGGWWLVGRAIRPIHDMSSAATRISAGDLSQRISAAETESELGRLAAILNSTFARLESAFAQQQRFAADAAHELRTPVSVMLTQTQTALTRDRSPDEYRQTVEACLRSAQRMRRLIESLLELARLDAGQESMKLMPLDLSQIVRENLQAADVLAEQCHVTIHTDLSSVKCTVDVERLGQVVLNLVTNAIQYNRSGGEVRLKLESLSGLAVLTVADTGTGISPEDLPRVFERFYRGDKSRTVSNGNAGLGLAISKAIIEAHGGTIEVASQPGQGTTFTVRLPLA